MSGSDENAARAAYLEAKGAYLVSKTDALNSQQTGGRALPSFNKKTSNSEKKPLIVHIVALAGAGKSTLGKRLEKHSNKLIVIELDDISDAIVKEMFENPDSDDYKKAFDPNTNYDRFFEHVEWKAQLKLREMLLEIGHTEKIIVLIGISVIVGTIPDITYIIDVSPEQLYRNLTLRTVKSIHDNYAEIQKLLENEKNIKILDLKLVHLYSLRRPIPLPNLNVLEVEIKEYVSAVMHRNGSALLMSSDSIYEHILKLSQS